MQADRNRPTKSRGRAVRTLSISERFISPVDLQVADGAADPRDQEVVLEVPVGAVHPAPWQPRRFFEQAAIEELAESIRRHLLHPITVRQRRRADGTTTGDFELIAGERRLRAAQLNAARDPGRHGTIQARVLDVSDQEARYLTLSENLARRDKRPWELALSYQELRESLSAAEGRVVGARFVADWTRHKFLAVSHYLRIADAVTEDVLRAAGYATSDGDIDYARVATLSKGDLMAAARAKTDAARVARLAAKAFDRPDARRRSRTGPNPSRVESEAAAFERYFREEPFAIRLCGPVAGFSVDEARAALGTMVPVVRALALQAYGPAGGVIPTDEGLVLVLPSAPATLGDEERRSVRALLTTTTELVT